MGDGGREWNFLPIEHQNHLNAAYFKSNLNKCFWLIWVYGTLSAPHFKTHPPFVHFCKPDGEFSLSTNYHSYNHLWFDKVCWDFGKVFIQREKTTTIAFSLGEKTREERLFQRQSPLRSSLKRNQPVSGTPGPAATYFNPRRCVHSSLSHKYTQLQCITLYPLTHNNLCNIFQHLACPFITPEGF